MALITLQISDRYDPAFLRAMTSMTSHDAWGLSAGEAVGTRTIIFDDAFDDHVLAAVNGYDAAWLDAAKRARIDEVAYRRKRAVADRFTFNDLPIVLDESTENALSKAHLALQRQPAGMAIDWEVSRGVFMPFDAPTIAAISDAAFLHVQACFSNAKRLTDLVDGAEDLPTLEALDLDTGWPT